MHSEHFSRARCCEDSQSIEPSQFLLVHGDRKIMSHDQQPNTHGNHFIAQLASARASKSFLGQLDHLVILRNLVVATTSSVETSRGHTSHFPTQGRRVVCFRVYFSMSTGSDRKVPISPSRTADPVRRSASEHRLQPRTPVQGPKSGMNHGTCEPQKTNDEILFDVRLAFRFAIALERQKVRLNTVDHVHDRTLLLRDCTFATPRSFKTEMHVANRPSAAKCTFFLEVLCILTKKVNTGSPSLLHLPAELPLRLPTDASLPQRPSRSGRDPKPHASDFFCWHLRSKRFPSVLPLFMFSSEML